MVPEHVRPGFHEAVQSVSPRIELALVSNEGPLPDTVADAAVFYRSVILRREVVDAVLQRAASLRWMHVPAAGVDEALTPHVVSRDFVVTHVAGIYDEPVSELVVAVMLAAAKHLRVCLDAQREHRWEHTSAWSLRTRPVDLPQTLRGKTVAILGFGGIGRSLAEKLHAFHMRVLGYRRSGEPDPLADAMYGVGQLPELLPQADWVVLTLPLTPDTRGMIGAAEIARMKPTAWLVNVGRGRVVDDDALVDALRSGRIGGACLDVFTQEPLPPESPYYDLPNVIVTPHIGGSFPELTEIDRDYFVDELRRFMNGEPLRSVVDRSTHY